MNRELLPQARTYLKSQGFEDILLPGLQTRLARAVQRDLPDGTVAELTVEPDEVESGRAGDVVAAIEHAAQPPARAVFVFGLGRLGSARARSAVIAELNLNRDHLWRTVPVPVVVWVADFVVCEFARHATDLWSGRSGVYRFVPEGADPAERVAAAARDIDWSRTPEERREREALLRELLDELNETGDDATVRAPLLGALGEAAAMEGRLVEAGELYGQALSTYREIGARRGATDALRGLGEALLSIDAPVAAGILGDAVRLYRSLDREDLAAEAQGLAAEVKTTN